MKSKLSHKMASQGAYPCTIHQIFTLLLMLLLIISIRMRKTINGKNTTHAMAIVLYLRLNALTESTIQKTNNRTLNLEVYDETEIQWYNKPRQKPVNWEVQNIQETSKPVK